MIYNLVTSVSDNIPQSDKCERELLFYIQFLFVLFIMFIYPLLPIILVN